MSTSKRALNIFGIPISVHTRKVILAARIKSIPYEVTPVVPVIPGNPPSNWRSISPLGSSPAIDDNGYILADSTAIVSYLDRNVAEPALLPKDAEAYGRALSLDAWAGAALFRQMNYPLFRSHYLGHRIDTARFPRLNAFFQHHLAAPLFADALEIEKPFVEQLALDRAFLR